MHAWKDPGGLVHDALLTRIYMHTFRRFYYNSAHGEGEEWEGVVTFMYPWDKRMALFVIWLFCSFLDIINRPVCSFRKAVLVMYDVQRTLPFEY